MKKSLLFPVCRPLLFLLLLQGLHLKNFAQGPAPFRYIPLPTNAYSYSKINRYKIFLDSIEEKNAAALEKTIRKDYKEIISQKNTGLLKDLSESDFLFDDTINPYLSKLFYWIVEKNDLSKHPFHFFVSRTAQVNAYTFEEGTVVCNLGLLNIVENESQLTMVFCHEIAHYLLAHSNTSIVTGLEKYNSPEFLAQIKSIKKEKYNTKNKLEDLVMEDVYNRRKHNRNHEQAADSLGMQLFLKTGYNTASVPHLYDLLDAEQTSTTACTIKSFFDDEGLPADEKWFAPVKRIAFSKPVTKEMLDSLKTHPDCSKRKLYATAFFSTHTVNAADFSPGGREMLMAIKTNSFFEQAVFSKDKKNMSRYFFYLLQNNARFPHNTFISTEIFNTLVLFTLAQKNHGLYTITEKPYSTEDDKDEYARLLTLLEKIDLNQLTAITKAYYDKNKELITLNAETTLHFEKIKQL